MRRREIVGFTLVEMLIVVAIIALLIALLLPALKGAREQARRAVCASNIRQFGVAAASYNVDSGYMPPGLGNPSESAVTSTLRDRYGIPARLVECPSLLNGLLNLTGVVRFPWATATKSNLTTQNGQIVERSVGCMGYLWVAGYALSDRYPSEGGFNAPFHYPLRTSGYWALISMTRPVYTFPVMDVSGNITSWFTIPPLASSKHLIMADMAYASVNPLAAATNAHNEFPQWGSHVADTLGNAAGGNYMMADLHVEWQPIIRGRSWKPFGRPNAYNDIFNYGYWTPRFAPPVNPNLEYLP